MTNPYCRYEGWDNLEINLLIDSISNLKTLRSLNLFYFDYFKSNHFTELIKGLKRNEYLHTLKLSNNS